MLKKKMDQIGCFIITFGANALVCKTESHALTSSGETAAGCMHWQAVARFGPKQGEHG
jgi:hypothetical protein